MTLTKQGAGEPRDDSPTGRCEIADRGVAATARVGTQAKRHVTDGRCPHHRDITLCPADAPQSMDRRQPLAGWRLFLYGPLGNIGGRSAKSTAAAFTASPESVGGCNASRASSSKGMVGYQQLVQINALP